MRHVTLNNGTVITEAEFVQQRGINDTLTDFVATKGDLKSLAQKLAQELLDDEYFLQHSVSSSDIAHRNYITDRLDRVLFHAPELVPEIQQILQDGRDKTRKDIQEQIECERAYAETDLECEPA